jgi:osmotically-inducible protein OsmY
MPLMTVKRNQEVRTEAEAGPSLLVEAPGTMFLAEQIERALRANGYPALRAIDVSVEGPRVVLKGRVPSYYMKQMAQVVTLAVAGVQELCNQVEVVPSAALIPRGVEGRRSFGNKGEKVHEW